jgi:PII-like signaling protein
VSELEMRLYFGERDRCGDGTLEAAVMEACARGGVRAAALLRGVEGFGRKHAMRTDRLLSLSEDLPLVAVAVGEAAAIEALAAEVEGLAAEGLLTLQETTTDTPTAAGVGVSVVVSEGVDGVEGRDLVRATVWGGRHRAGAPHLGAVDALRRHGADSAVVLLGVDGALEGERRRARWFAANRDVPTITVGVGERTAIEAALAEVGVELSPRTARATLHRRPGVRVTLVTTEIASSGGHPRYIQFVHALRREGAAGATALRGVWGFRGEREPHGDRVLALRRDVPVVVEVVDSPERAERWRELALGLAGEDDVVCTSAVGMTSERDR